MSEKRMEEMSEEELREYVGKNLDESSGKVWIQGIGSVDRCWEPFRPGSYQSDQDRCYYLKKRHYPRELIYPTDKNDKVTRMDTGLFLTKVTGTKIKATSEIPYGSYGSWGEAHLVYSPRNPEIKNIGICRISCVPNIGQIFSGATLNEEGYHFNVNFWIGRVWNKGIDNKIWSNEVSIHKKDLPDFYEGI